jgi:AhpD family alkylhydroperoxidase
MEARMKNPAMVLGDAMKGIGNLYKAMHQGGVPEATLELVHMRASQINGCSACVTAGMYSARKTGETDERLLLLTVWRETSAFTDAERAALALTEAATRLADRADAVTDEIWQEATRHYDEKGSVRDHPHDRHHEHVQPHQRHNQGTGRRNVGLVD